jgi:uncharacterized protein (DUF433 family)
MNTRRSFDERGPHEESGFRRSIEKVPVRCGGRAVVAGTRIRVCTILWCHRQSMSVEEILEQYPHLRPSNVYDALAYAYDNLAEVEKDLADDDKASVLDRLGIVGYAKGLPADYSTNEDYMKDFGRERSSDDTSNHDA